MGDKRIPGAVEIGRFMIAALCCSDKSNRRAVRITRHRFDENAVGDVLRSTDVEIVDPGLALGLAHGNVGMPVAVDIREVNRAVARGAH